MTLTTNNQFIPVVTFLKGVVSSQDIYLIYIYFNCLGLSNPDEDKSRKALCTHEIFKVLFSFIDCTSVQ